MRGAEQPTISADLIHCIGCSALVPDSNGPTHDYIGASPGCWQIYGDVLAREYGDPALMRAHQVTVDTYAVQHPGVPGPRSSQSVALHLMSLCLVLERGATPDDGTQLLMRVPRPQPRPVFPWLEPPAPPGALTILEVRGATTAADYVVRRRAWAESTWAAWSAHHETVRGWLDRHDGR